MYSFIAEVEVVVVSVSSTFYEQLLCTKIPKAQKKTDSLSVSFVLLGSVHIKAASKMLVKLNLSFSFGVTTLSVYVLPLLSHRIC